MKVRSGRKNRAFLVVLFLLSEFSLFNFYVPKVCAGLSGWSYSDPYTLIGSAGAGTNYQVKVVIHYGSGTDSSNHLYLNSLCKTDFGDIRFTRDDQTTQLSYWMESKVDSDNAVFWVKVDDDLSSGEHTIYVYYGNPSATTTSNGDNTFIFFDDFAGGSLNATKWDTLQGSIGVDGSGNLLLEGTTGTVGKIQGKVSFPIGSSINAKGKAGNTDPDWMKWCAATDNGDSSQAQISIGYGSTGGLFTTWKTGLYTQTAIALATINAWHTYNIQWRTNYAKAFQDQTSLAVHTTNIPAVNMKYFIQEGTENGETFLVDWVYVRKYVDPEPAPALHINGFNSWNWTVLKCFRGTAGEIESGLWAQYFRGEFVFSYKNSSHWIIASYNPETDILTVRRAHLVADISQIYEIDVIGDELYYVAGKFAYPTLTGTVYKSSDLTSWNTVATTSAETLLSIERYTGPGTYNGYLFIGGVDSEGAGTFATVNRLDGGSLTRVFTGTVAGSDDSWYGIMFNSTQMVFFDTFPLNMIYSSNNASSWTDSSSTSVFELAGYGELRGGVLWMAAHDWNSAPADGGLAKWDGQTITSYDYNIYPIAMVNGSIGGCLTLIPSTASVSPGPAFIQKYKTDGTLGDMFMNTTENAVITSMAYDEEGNTLYALLNHDSEGILYIIGSVTNTPPTISQFGISAGILSDQYFDFYVTLTDIDGASDIDHSTLTIGSVWLYWDRASNIFIEMSDPLNLCILDADNCKSILQSANSYQLKYRLKLSRVYGEGYVSPSGSVYDKAGALGQHTESNMFFFDVTEEEQTGSSTGTTQTTTTTTTTAQTSNMTQTPTPLQQIIQGFGSFSSDFASTFMPGGVGAGFVVPSPEVLRPFIVRHGSEIIIWLILFMVFIGLLREEKKKKEKPIDLDKLMAIKIDFSSVSGKKKSNRIKWILIVLILITLLLFTPLGEYVKATLGGLLA